MNPTTEDCMRNYHNCLAQRATLIEQASVLESAALWWREMADDPKALAEVEEPITITE